MQVIISSMTYLPTKRDEYFGDKDTLYLFGDNSTHTGKGGQAVIRDAINAIGIPTKRYPSMSENAFFSDNDYDDIIWQILSSLKLITELSQWGTFTKIHIPASGLGTGLAELQLRAPMVFDFLSQYLYEHYGFINPGYKPQIDG